MENNNNLNQTDKIRKRGRPRMNLDAQKSAERRRTQLRQAQRAYRSRKDKTISDLQNRVEELESGIEELSGLFLSFSETLLQTDLSRYPHLTEALHHVTERCVAIAKTCEDGSGNETSNENEHEHEHDTDQASSSRDLISLNIDPMLTFSPILSPILSPVPVMNMNERLMTFPEYLVRACFQNATRLLMNKPLNSPTLKHIFGFNLTASDHQRLVSSFRARLQDDSDTLPIDVLTTLAYNGGLLSPRALQLGLESGAGTEWLDASGVLRFLRKRGIDIDNLPAFPVERMDENGEFESFDPAAFIQFLTTVAICVGSGPAFQRGNVEVALNLALRG